MTVQGLLRALPRHTLLRANQPWLCMNRVPMATATAYKEMEHYWEKNKQMNRPISPHLTSFKPHTAMVMSISHRITGVYLATLFSGASIMFLCLPESYPYYLDMLKSVSMGPVIIAGLKYSLALPVTYHFLNGIRHLMWDAGYGFKLKDVRLTGYAVLGLTLLLSSMLVFCT